MVKIAFLGLGVMGYPMAGHLQQSLGDVCVYNRTTATAQQWVSQYGGTHAITLSEAVKNCDVVFSCVGDDDDLMAICLGGEGAFSAMKSGAIFVDHTTTSDTVAKEMYKQAKSMGLDFIDAPVSGGQIGAQNGALTIMCGGDETVFKKIKPIMQPYTKHSSLIGDSGAGQQCKMINQIAFTHTVQGLSEGITFAKKAGLNTDKVFEAISGGAAGSWQMDNRWKTMSNNEFNFGFAVDLGLKDLNLVLECAKNMGLDIPTTEQLKDFYRELQSMGYGRNDTSALVRRYKDQV